MTFLSEIAFLPLHLVINCAFLVVSYFFFTRCFISILVYTKVIFLLFQPHLGTGCKVAS